jgi:ATP-dependent protease HslVU (ClpYQ) peptidase subunit
MTCIVGLLDNDRVYIGGDRAIGDDSNILSSLVPKVVSRNDWLYGYAGTIGIGQLMDIITLPPAHTADYRTIKTKIVPALSVAIDNYARDVSDHDTQWIIGVNHRLYEVSAADWGVLEVGYTSIGAGSQYALGSIYTSICNPPDVRVRLALEAAITFSPGCQGPIDVFSL